MTGFLQITQYRHQFMQFRHTIGGRAVKAYGDGITVQFTRFIGFFDIMLRVEDHSVCFDVVILFCDRTDFNDTATQVAGKHFQATSLIEKTASLSDNTAGSFDSVTGCQLSLSLSSSGCCE